MSVQMYWDSTSDLFRVLYSFVYLVLTTHWQWDFIDDIVCALVLWRHGVAVRIESLALIFLPTHRSHVSSFSVWVLPACLVHHFMDVIMCGRGLVAHTTNMCFGRKTAFADLLAA